jgi:hypothetical protein
MVNEDEILFRNETIQLLQETRTKLDKLSNFAGEMCLNEKKYFPAKNMV